MTSLVVTATVREAEAVVRDLGPVRRTTSSVYETFAVPEVFVVAGGIGMAEAAAATAYVLGWASGIETVFSLGVAGGHGVAVGDVTVGRTVTRADTGVQQADGSFQTTKQAIGMGDSGIAISPESVPRLMRLGGAVRAHVLSVATVTGTAERAREIIERQPYDGPYVEDMEAWGVVIATRPWNLPVAVVKAVSNEIGPRDRSAWDLDGALAALSRSAFALFTEPLDVT